MADAAVQGIKAFQAGRYTEAIAAFSRALEARPEDPKLHLLLARAYHHEANFALAQAHYEAAIAGSEDPPLVSVAQQGLDLAARHTLPGTPAPAPAPALQLPSRPRAGLQVCPGCGEALASGTCVCGFNMADPERLGLDLVHAFSARREVLVVVRKGRDHYLIDHEQVRYRSAGNLLHPVDPRLVFPPIHGVPVMWEYELAPLQPPGLKVMISPLPGKAGENRLLGFEAFVSEVAETLGLEAPLRLPAFDMAALYRRHRLLPKGEIVRLQAAADHWGMTFGQALMKSTQSPPRLVLQAMIGQDVLFRPTNRMSNGLAGDLMADGLLTPEVLQDLLARQVEYPRHMVQLVLSATSLTEAELAPYVEAARAQRPVRPVRDRLGEILVAQGAIGRTRLDEALDLSRGRSQLLGSILEELGVPRKAIDQALHHQRVKDQLRFGGQVRLGEILVKRGVISRQQLLETLIEQIDQPLPLGELLIQRGSATPEQVYLGLCQQEATLEAFVRIEVDLEGRDQAPGAGHVLSFSIDLDQGKQKLGSLFGNLKEGLKSGLQEVKTALQAIQEASVETPSAEGVDRF